MAHFVVGQDAAKPPFARCHGEPQRSEAEETRAARRAAEPLTAPQATGLQAGRPWLRRCAAYFSFSTTASTSSIGISPRGRVSRM